MSAPTVYLAGPYDARPMIASHAAALRVVGLTVRAEWLDGTHDYPDPPDDPAAAAAVRAAHEQCCALLDLADIDHADLLIAFTAASVMSSGTSGGRHVETGYALGHGIPVVVVGEPENVFHHHPEVHIADSWEDAYRRGPLADLIVTALGARQQREQPVPCWACGLNPHTRRPRTMTMRLDALCDRHAGVQR